MNIIVLYTLGGFAEKESRIGKPVQSRRSRATVTGKETLHLHSGGTGATVLIKRMGRREEEYGGQEPGDLPSGYLLTILRVKGTRCTDSSIMPPYCLQAFCCPRADLSNTFLPPSFAHVSPS